MNVAEVREHQQTIIDLAEHIIAMGDGKNHCAVEIREAAAASLAILDQALTTEVTP